MPFVTDHLDLEGSNTENFSDTTVTVALPTLLAMPRRKELVAADVMYGRHYRQSTGYTEEIEVKWDHANVSAVSAFDWGDIEALSTLLYGKKYLRIKASSSMPRTSGTTTGDYWSVRLAGGPLNVVRMGDLQLTPNDDGTVAASVTLAVAVPTT